MNNSHHRPWFLPVTTAAALLVSVAAPSFAASVQFFDDPETMQVHYLPDGRVSFAKEGAYLGPMKGERCNAYPMKDMKHDRVEPVCKPLSGGMATWGKGVGILPHVSGWTASPYLLSAGLIGEVMAQAPTSYTLPLVTELVALNFKPAGVASFPRTQPLEGPVAQVQTPAIPLPASVWMMLAGLAMLWRFA